jgi:hypothetical protein
MALIDTLPDTLSITAILEAGNDSYQFKQQKKRLPHNNRTRLIGESSMAMGVSFWLSIDSSMPQTDQQVGIKAGLFLRITARVGDDARSLKSIVRSKMGMPMQPEGIRLSH